MRRGYGHEGKSNMQMWISDDLRKPFEKIAKEKGFDRWQILVETLFAGVINGDIEIYPPKAKTKQKPQT